MISIGFRYSRTITSSETKKNPVNTPVSTDYQPVYGFTWRHPSGDGPAYPEVLYGAGACGEEALVLLGPCRALAGFAVALPAERVVEDDVEGRGAGAARAVAQGDLGKDPGKK